MQNRDPQNLTKTVKLFSSGHKSSASTAYIFFKFIFTPLTIEQGGEEQGEVMSYFEEIGL